MPKSIDAPLTHAQRDYLAYEAAFPGTRINALYGLCTFREAYDANTLNCALRLLTENEQGLRLRIRRGADGEFRQYDTPGVFESIETLTFPDAAQMQTWLNAQRQEPLPHLDAPLVRFTALRAEGGLHLLIAAHHIAADGYMLSLLASRVGTLCQYLRRGETPVLTPHEVFSRAFEEGQASFTMRRERDLAWWLTQYQDWNGPCRLTPGRIFDGNPEGARLCCPVPSALWEKVLRFCTAGALSPAVPFETAWILLLHQRNPGKRLVDVCLNVHDRCTIAQRQTIGAFAAGRMLLVRPDGGDSFRTLLQKTLDAGIRAARHYTVTSDELLSLAQQWTPEAEDGYDLECSYLPPIGDSADVKKTWLSNNMPETTAEFTLFHLNAHELPQMLFDYRTSMLSPAEAKALLCDMLRLLEQGLDRPDSAICEVRT